MRVIARRSDDVWLLSDKDVDPAPTVRVLDRSIGRLYPSHPREAVLVLFDWEMLADGERPDADKLLEGVHVMPDEGEVPPMFVAAGHGA
jgi:hypothetical protein